MKFSKIQNQNLNMLRIDRHSELCILKSGRRSWSITSSAKLTEDIPARRSTSQLQDILHALYPEKGKDQVRSTSPGVTESIKSRAQIIIYSDFLDDPKLIADIVHHMRIVKMRSYFSYYGPTGSEFIFDRPTRFMDLRRPIPPN